jgi:hypothetical protein
MQQTLHVIVWIREAINFQPFLTTLESVKILKPTPDEGINPHKDI